MSRQLEIVPEDWDRAMAVVAHPDDLEYGAASAVARWTGDGKAVAHVIATDGEAGIDGLDPTQAGPLRRREQVASAAVVGMHDVTFLGHRDAVVENGLALRRDLARQIRRFRPDLLVTATYDLTYRMGAAGRIVNQADHRASVWRSSTRPATRVTGGSSPSGSTRATGRGPACATST
jgi:LmbE family N-acetylglucosaminyl deacetylase